MSIFHRSQLVESGAVLVMFALYTTVLMTLMALGVNVYLIGNALMQQRNTVEYVALAVMKVAEDPQLANDPNCNQSELSLLNCIFSRAEVAGRVGFDGNRTRYHLQQGALRVMNRGSVCANSGGGSQGLSGEVNITPVAVTGMAKDDFCWSAYESADASRAEVVMGSYSVNATRGEGSFTAAAADEVRTNNFNAVKLRFHIDPSADATMVAPLIKLFGEGLKLKFSSSAIAYRSSGRIYLAIDPSLSLTTSQ